MNINGNWFNIARFKEETLYSSPYIVAKHQGYTKHYYAGSERIASAIGLGGLANIDTPLELDTYHHSWEDKSFSLKRYKYCGKERDEETGLYYYGMRYYAAWLCRFINVDPLQFKYPYYTPFQYAGNKPITYIDLDGGEPDKNTGKIKATFYFQFEDKLELTPEEQQEYIDAFKANVRDTWNSYTYNGMSVNVDEVQFVFADGKTENDLGSYEFFIKVGNGSEADKRAIPGRSYVNGNTGYMYYDSKNLASEAGHELGHLLGLSDRNVRFFVLDGFRRLHDIGAMALYMKKDFSRSNLMGRNGSFLTQKQLSYVFEHKKEPRHIAPIVITWQTNNFNISDSNFAKIEGLRVVVGNVNSKGEFYPTNKNLGNARLIMGTHFTFDLGSSITPKNETNIHKEAFHESSRSTKIINNDLMRFFKQ